MQRHRRTWALLGLLALGIRAHGQESLTPAPQESQEPEPQQGGAAPAQEPPAAPPAAPAATEPPAAYAFLEDRNSLLAAWSRSGIVESLELGTSVGGRELFGVQFGASGPRPLSERPTILLVGGLDGLSLSGSQTVLTVVSSLLAHPENLPPQAAFLAVPWANPDGLARWRSRGYGGGKNDRGIDEDGDGQVDEDGPDDLDHDGLILEMLLEDPQGPWVRSSDERFLRPAREGEAPRYVRLREGLDDDGDGAFNEDGPGGVVLDHNFPLGWEDGADVESGPWPLSEPDSNALAQLALARRTAVVLVFQGNHGMLASPGGRDPARAHAELPLAEDQPTYRGLVAVFDSHTGRSQTGAMSLREARGGPWAGSLVDWTYVALGALAMEVGIWGPTVQHGGRSPVDAYFKNPPDAEKSDVSPVERAWAAWLDDTRGGIGFVDWQPVELPGTPGAWIGGWEPNTSTNPPVDVLPQAMQGMDGFVLDLAKNLPNLEIDLREAKREGRVCLLRARVKNLGTLPSGVGPSSSANGVHLRLEIPTGVTLLAGELATNLGHLPGRGTSEEYRWLISAPEGTLLRLVVESPWSPPSVREVRL